MPHLPQSQTLTCVSSEELLKVQDRRECQLRGLKLLQYAFIAGAAIGALQFADDVALEAPEWQRFVTQFCPFVVQGAAGSRGLGRANSRILCCSSRRITALEPVCLHDAGTHQTPAEASQGSSLHVLNPWSAAAVAKVLQFHLTQRNLLVPWGSWRNLCSKPESAFDKVEDGGGQFSTANWLRPQRPDFFRSYGQIGPRSSCNAVCTFKWNPLYEASFPRHLFRQTQSSFFKNLSRGGCSATTWRPTGQFLQDSPCDSRSSSSFFKCLTTMMFACRTCWRRESQSAFFSEFPAAISGHPMTARKAVKKNFCVAKATGPAPRTSLKTLSRQSQKRCLEDLLRRFLEA